MRFYGLLKTIKNFFEFSLEQETGESFLPKQTLHTFSCCFFVVCLKKKKKTIFVIFNFLRVFFFFFKCNRLLMVVRYYISFCLHVYIYRLQSYYFLSISPSNRR